MNTAVVIKSALCCIYFDSY